MYPIAVTQPRHRSRKEAVPDIAATGGQIVALFITLFIEKAQLNPLGVR